MRVWGEGADGIRRFGRGLCCGPVGGGGIRLSGRGDRVEDEGGHTESVHLN